MGSENEVLVVEDDTDMREVMEDRVPQARIYRAYHAPAFADAEVSSLELFASVLSGSRSARLDRRLVYERGLATVVTATVYPSELASLVVVTADVKPGIDPAQVEREMDGVVSELLQQGPTGPELQRARSRILSAFARNAVHDLHLGGVTR